jgi:ferredoxin
MADPRAIAVWRRIRDAASEAGLTIAWVLPRVRVDLGFKGKTERGVTPAQLHPGYRSAIVLGSGGARFWERFRTATPGNLNVETNPLDRFTESEVEKLIGLLREADPGAVAAYPFRHERQLLPFAGLTQDIAAFRVAPFGVLIDPVHGPWFAWRAALLTSLELPPHVPDGDAPCLRCPAPCVTACPVGAVDLNGFRWRDCVSHRVAATSCRERCLAREACPVGVASRYPGEAIRYHYGASLRMIRLSETQHGLRA